MNRSCAATTSISLRAQRRNKAFDRSLSAISTRRSRRRAQRVARVATARSNSHSRRVADGDHESLPRAVGTLRATTPAASRRLTPRDDEGARSASRRTGARVSRPHVLAVCPGQRPANAAHQLRPAGRSSARPGHRPNNDVATSQPKLAAITRHRPGGRLRLKVLSSLRSRAGRR